ncbi:MAG: hypothetical protein SOZ14_10650 [Candidatus Pseudoscilispira sp.]|nr:hypothetical protein [bacterium 210917-SL.2.15]MDY4037674.1 hypothetical protein [Candidatus Pseudoscilispira sp.]
MSARRSRQLAIEKGGPLCQALCTTIHRSAVSVTWPHGIPPSLPMFGTVFLLWLLNMLPLLIFAGIILAVVLWLGKKR